MTDHEYLERAYGFKDKLFALALSRLKNEEDANDAVVEVILKGLRKKDQLREVDRLIGWLAKIMVNHCHDIFRKRKRIPKDEVERELADKGLDLDLKVSIAHEIERILDIMLAIEPEDHRDVLVLYFYRKMSYGEIAEFLDVPEGTVKSRMSRAKPKLIDAFKKHNINEDDLKFVGDMDDWPLV